MSVYNICKKQLLDADQDFNLPDDYRVLLLRADGFTPNFDPDHATITAVLADAGNTEVSVSGYARTAMTGETTVQDDTNDRADARANKVTFTSLATGQTVGAAVVYDEGGGTDGTRIPIAFYDLTDTPTNGGNIEIRWDGVDGVGTFLRLT